MNYPGYENRDAKEIHCLLGTIRKMKWENVRPEVVDFLKNTADRQDEEWVALTPNNVRMM